VVAGGDDKPDWLSYNLRLGNGRVRGLAVFRTTCGSHDRGLSQERLAW
jgi:hypothetical protein